VAGGAAAPTDGRLVAWPAHPQRHRAREPEHALDPPVPIVARIVWEHEGEQHIETIALG
jgi:hypothetical protein